MIAVLALAALPAEGQKITEVVADHVGSPDAYEYIEIYASPSANLWIRRRSGQFELEVRFLRLPDGNGFRDLGSSSR